MSIAVEVDAGAAAASTRATTAELLVNFVAFQGGWFACVLGAAYGHPALGTATAAAIVTLHIARAPHQTAEAKLIAWALVIGAIYDSALVMLGWVAYPTGTIVAGTAPHWILALWALFAMTLNFSLLWLRGRFVLAAVLGAVCGPLSYSGGAKLGALVLSKPAPALAALAVGWAVLMPLLTALAARFESKRARS